MTDIFKKFEATPKKPRERLEYRHWSGGSGFYHWDNRWYLARFEDHSEYPPRDKMKRVAESSQTGQLDLWQS